jgi:hypothetical protein
LVQKTTRKVRRRESQLADNVRGFERGDASAAIVLRACADIPGIQVPADHHYFVRPLASGDFADDVGRIRFRQGTRFHLQVRGHRISRVHQALNQERVFDGDGGGRDLRKSVGIFERAGVRRLKAEGRDGAHQRRHRAQACRARWPSGAINHRAVVAFVRHVEQNDLALDGGAPFPVELFETRYGHNLRRDSALGRGHAGAQAQDGERLVHRFQQRGAFIASHPVRNLDAWRDDVGEAVGLHLRSGPCDRLIQRRGTAEAIPDSIAEVGEPLHAALVGQRGVDQFGRAVVVLLR